MKADVGRVIHQIRRGFIRLEDCVSGWEAKEEKLKTNLEAAKSEIADTFTKYVKVRNSVRSNEPVTSILTAIVCLFWV